MNRLLTGVMTLATFLSAASFAKADHYDPLYIAADNYRDIVREFERLSDRDRYLDRYTERNIDRLYSAANSLRAAAKRPENASRLSDCYYEASSLQQRVEVGLFSGAPVDLRLVAAYRDVQQSFAVLANLIEGGAIVQPGVTSRRPTLGNPGWTVPVPARPDYRSLPSPWLRPSPFSDGRFGSGWTAPDPSCDLPARGARVIPNSGIIPGPQVPIDAGFGSPFGQRAVPGRGGTLLSIGAQLMRLLD